jgi:hypothetical protein
MPKVDRLEPLHGDKLDGCATLNSFLPMELFIEALIANLV